jgi:hypothetical protein
MRLSEAMALGRVTCVLEKGNWNSCALGCAANAVGIPQWGNAGRDRYVPILAYWPWLDRPCPCGRCDCSAARHIWSMFDDKVCFSEMTMEQLIDWVRLHEPKPLGLPTPAQDDDLWGVELTAEMVNDADFGVAI